MKKQLFIPNWNGHLFLQEYDDKSITKLFDKFKSKNKILINVEKNNIKKTNQIIEEEFLKYFNKDNLILSITGDHSNTYSLVKAFAKKNKDFKLIIFDAHPDVEVGTDLVSHEDYLRKLIEDKIIKSKNVYLFGIRTFSRIEFEYLIKKKIHFWTISDILKDKNNIKEILKSIKGVIYLSVDIDVLDPDIAPATYYREWCGLNLNELINFVSIIKSQISSVDITEFYSEKDEDNITKNNILKLINFFK